MQTLAAQTSPRILSSSCVLLLAQPQQSAVVQHTCVQRCVHRKDPLPEGCAVSITALTIATSNSKKRCKGMLNDAAAPALSQHTHTRTKLTYARQGATQICARTRLQGTNHATAGPPDNVYHSSTMCLTDNPQASPAGCYALASKRTIIYPCRHTYMKYHQQLAALRSSGTAGMITSTAVNATSSTLAAATGWHHTPTQYLTTPEPP
jgi:hypothetical protein